MAKRALCEDEIIRMELNEILRHKWIESEKAGHDVGLRAVWDWIEHHEEAFHRDFERAHTCSRAS